MSGVARCLVVSQAGWTARIDILDTGVHAIYSRAWHAVHCAQHILEARCRGWDDCLHGAGCSVGML